MKLPLSWLKDYVEIDLPVEELAHRLTLAGLEVEEIHYAGLPLPGISAGPGVLRHETKSSGIGSDPGKIVVGASMELMQHPIGDRLEL